MKNKKRKCKICGKYFIPSPYSWNQRVCFRQQCRRLAKRQTMAEWRNKNPDYFRPKGSILEKWKKSKNNWRKRNVNYAKNWRRKNRERYNAYMREYMRKLRATVKKE